MERLFFNQDENKDLFTGNDMLYKTVHSCTSAVTQLPLRLRRKRKHTAIF